MNFRSDINFFRAFAVVVVIFFHYEFTPFSGGYIGVDIFFVISGFLMTQIISDNYKKSTFSLLGFYRARALRIVPALAYLIGVILFLGWFFLNPNDYRKTALSAGAALTFVSNILFWRTTDYFNDQTNEMFLHTWSLSVEWQFYLIYPLILVAINRLTQNIQIIRRIYWSLIALSLLLATVLSTTYANLGFYLLPTRAWEMLAGGQVFLYAGTRISERLRTIFFALATMALSVSTVYFSPTMPWPSIWTCFPVFGTALLLFLNLNYNFFSWKVIRLTGNISYSLYLWHWPILMFWRRFYPSHAESIYLLMPLTLTVFVSYLSYRFIEQRPLHLTGRRGLSFRGVTYASLTVLLIGASAVIWQTNGILSRGVGTPEIYKTTLSAMQDWEYPASCGFKPNSNQLNICEVGTNDARHRTLFIGDSHAEQWFARYRAKYASNKQFYVAFATYGGCPPFAGVNRTSQGFDCPAFNSDVLRLAQSGVWDKIIIQSFWPAYFINLRDGSDNQLLCKSMASGCTSSTLNLDKDFEFLRGSLGQTVRNISTVSTKVYIVMPAPYSQNNFVTEKLNSDFFGESFLWSSGIDQATFQQQTFGINKLLRLVAQDTGAVLIDPINYVCTDGRCPILDDNGQLRYRDGNHYRASFVKVGVSYLDAYVMGSL